jgi:hypothetical protein
MKITLWGFDAVYIGTQLSIFHVPEKHTASIFRGDEYYNVHKSLPLSYLKPVLPCKLVTFKRRVRKVIIEVS